MTKIDISFEWPVARAGYRIENVPPPERTGKTSTSITGQPRGLLIKPKRGPYDVKRPLEFPLLFTKFATLDGKPESCLKFAAAWGLLGSMRGGSKPEEESIVIWQRTINEFRQDFDLWQAGALVLRHEVQPVTNLSVNLVERAGGGYKMELRPKSLLSAMALQLIKAIATDKAIRACDWCGDWFELGAGTGRRMGARFCSDRCRHNFHNARRARETSQ